MLKKFFTLLWILSFGLTNAMAHCNTAKAAAKTVISNWEKASLTKASAHCAAPLVITQLAAIKPSPANPWHLTSCKFLAIHQVSCFFYYEGGGANLLLHQDNLNHWTVMSLQPVAD